MITDYRNIEKDTLKNTNYRKVVYTDKKMQLVLMSLNKTEDIPSEIHKHTTQFIKVSKGVASITVGDTIHTLTEGDSIVIPAGKKHCVKNVPNASSTKLKLYTIYTPPEHKPNTIQKRQIK